MTMPDITDRLRRWTIATDAVPASDLMDEAADEIERLRKRNSLWERCAAKTVQMYGGVVRPEQEQALEDAAVQLAGLVRITDAERDAVERLIGIVGPCADAATLRGLLERTDPRLAAIERLAELEQELRSPDETA